MTPAALRSDLATPAFDAAANDRVAPLEVKYFRDDGSVFVEGRYLIRGVAGAVLAKLLRDHLGRNRTEFCLRELRRDPSLRLPDLGDNLAARMLLLQKRVAEQCPHLALDKVARGLFRFGLRRPVEFHEL